MIGTGYCAVMRRMDLVGFGRCCGLGSEVSGIRVLGSNSISASPQALRHLRQRLFKRFSVLAHTSGDQVASIGLQIAANA